MAPRYILPPVGRAPLGALPAALLCFFAGCGPGLEAIHESNVRFEHCYRLDMDPKIAPSHREHCWRDWTRTYAYGQSRDRIEYARRRIIALESGDKDRLAIETDPEPRERIFIGVPAGEEDDSKKPIAAPAPTSAHKSPPTTAPDEGASKKEEADENEDNVEPEAPAAPGQSCASGCKNDWQKCSGKCKGDEEKCAACREDYRGCMRRCFE